MALPSKIQQFIDEQADQARTRYDDLRAVIFNGTTKRSPEMSHTDGLLDITRGIFARVGVQCQRFAPLTTTSRRVSGPTCVSTATTATTSPRCMRRR